MAHFTYVDAQNMHLDSLCQGDILQRTPELDELIKEVHPYFLNEQYKYFIVITQTCDLVRRKSKPCNSQYITLAAVRTFDDYLMKEVCKYQSEFEFTYKLLNISKKNEIVQTLERLYNNNESDYFFLHKDEPLMLTQNYVAFLKVSIAIKTELHYEKCLKAKIVELSDDFKAKLGWLVGQMYSRVGTRDWSDFITRDALTKEFSGIIKDAFYLPTDNQIQALKEASESGDLDPANAVTEVNRIMDLNPPRTNREVFLDTIKKIIDTSDVFNSDFDIDKAKKTLFRQIESNTTVKSLTK